jgi:hypothetical protein
MHWGNDDLARGDLVDDTRVERLRMMSIVLGNAVVGKRKLVRTLIRFGFDGSGAPSSSSTGRLVPR